MMDEAHTTATQTSQAPESATPAGSAPESALPADTAPAGAPSASVATGEEQLAAYAARSFGPARTDVSARVHHYLGYGHSSATVIEGDTSLILVDTLDSPDCAREMMADVRTYTTKPVKTIIYTHGHPDYRGGAGAFRDTVEEIICMAPVATPLPGYDRLEQVLGARGRRQHGYGLTDDEALCQGIGIREGKERGRAGYDFLPPTTV